MTQGGERSRGWGLLWGLADGVLGRLDALVERKRAKRGDWAAAAVLLLPATAILAVFGAAPLFLAARLSLYAGKGVHMRFAGLANYGRAFGSEQFWNSCAVTAYFALGTAPVSIGVSFLIASMLCRIARGRGWFRTVYFLPYVTSVVAAATVWRELLDPRFGPVNALLSLAGVEDSALPQWLMEPRGALHVLTGGLIPQGAGPSLALTCVMLFEIWHVSGFMIVVLLAGLMAIPREMDEAAIVDGASWRQRTWHVTVPLLSPTLFFLGVISVIKAFQAFNSFYALTGDGRGPVNSTQSLTVYIFTNLYEYQRLGYGAAVAVLLAGAIAGLTLLQWRFIGRRVHY